MKSSLSKKLLLLSTLLFSFYFGAQNVITTNFSLTGSTQTFAIPSCVSDITITIAGGAGGNAGWGNAAPAMVNAIMTPTTGQVLYINVGGMGTGTLGGWNGGGNGGIGTTNSGAGGGGATDIRIGGNALSDRIIVMGGGGGSGSTPQTGGNGGLATGWPLNCTSLSGCGGGGGWGTVAGGTGSCTGGTATTYGTGGGGGGMTSGGGISGSGLGGFGGGGSSAQGGNGGGAVAIYGGTNGGINGGGGGGGGYFGGAGGMCGDYTESSIWPLSGGGGAGSSYINAAFFPTVTAGGIWSSNGFVIIAYTLVNSTFSVTGPANICSGSSAGLSASGASTYTWLPAGGFPGSNSPSIAVNPTATTLYTVQGTTSSGCLPSMVFTVEVENSVPSLSVSNTSSLNGGVCPNQSVTLSASGASNISWSGGVISGTPFIPASNNQTYIVSGSNICGTSTAAVSVSIHPLPVINVLPVSPTLCPGSSLILNATGTATNYSWSGGSSPITNGVVFIPVSSQVYTVAATSAFGCTSSTTILVSLVPGPTISISASSYTTCSLQTVSVTGNGANAANNYTWFTTNGTATTSGLGQTYIDSPFLTTTYSVTGGNSQGCTSSASVTILVYPNPVLTVTANKNLVCSNAGVTLTAGGADSYSWSANANSATTPTAIANPTATISGPVIYSVQGTSSVTGCTNTKTLLVNVFIPTLTVNGNTIACYGGSVNLNSSGGVTGSYNWITGDGMPHPVPNLAVPITSASVFTLTANSSSAGVVCAASKTISVGVYPVQQITAVAENTTICLNESVKLTASGSVISYNWSNTASTPTTLVTPPVGLSQYSISGKDANGCSTTATVEIEVLECTGISTVPDKATAIAIYPNPSNGEFTIRATKALKLTLINSLGQQIKTIDLSPLNNLKESMIDLPAGVYCIRDTGLNNLFSEKIIISR